MRKAVILLLPCKNTPKQESRIQQNFVILLLIAPVSADDGVYHKAQIRTLQWGDHKGYELSSQEANGRDTKYQPRTKIYF